ncbi:MAG: diaminopimelate epimerase [Gilvibacter sp.]
MSIPFTKYHGTGNDFVLIDNRQDVFNHNDTALVAAMCNRRFGVGADGLILLEHHSEYDFTMVYFNADGNPSSMCGNGGRCIVHFANQLGIVQGDVRFMAVDGLHTATIDGDIISLKMADVKSAKIADGYSFLDTGSPHHVIFTEQIDSIDVKTQGAAIRYGLYGEQGANVNFVQQIDVTNFKVRTYERGVEDETYSCGTGVTAVALAAFQNKLTDKTNLKLHTPGGLLSVRFKDKGVGFTNVHLIGPAMAVYTGVWE